MTKLEGQISMLVATSELEVSIQELIRAKIRLANAISRKEAGRDN